MNSVIATLVLLCYSASAYFLIDPKDIGRVCDHNVKIQSHGRSESRCLDNKDLDTFFALANAAQEDGKSFPCYDKFCKREQIATLDSHNCYYVSKYQDNHEGRKVFEHFLDNLPMTKYLMVHPSYICWSDYL